jgi:uncharacterized protein
MSEKKGAGMSTNEDTVRRGYEAFGQGDMDTLRSIMTPDVVQNVPGTSQIAGEYKGIDSVLGYYGKLFELTGGNFKADLQSAKAEGSDKVVAVHHITGQRGGKSYDHEETLDFTFTGGKISRLDEVHADQAKFDDFWS